MKDSDRHSLIQYRIRQAKETIELADFLIASNKLAVAVNRIYYGMYYALTALALKYNYETSKHAQLIGWFNKEFVSNDLLDKKYGKILRNAYQNRTKGDYDAFVDFSRAEVEELLNEMKQFISAVESIL
jgi:uncharacterized protein (UPF0332 family)